MLARVKTLFNLFQLFQSVGLLINMVEHCDHNRSSLLVAPAVEPFDDTSESTDTCQPTDFLTAITKVRVANIQHGCGADIASVLIVRQLFLLRHAAAKRMEEEHDRLLEQRERSQKSDARNSQQSVGSGELVERNEK